MSSQHNSSIIGRGAEALLYRAGEVVLKVRPQKEYRISEIDQRLRKSRTKKEAAILKKLESIGVLAPRLVSVDFDKRMEITMSFIDGEKVRDVLESDLDICKEIGHLVGLLHKNDVIHSDLTTSNMVLGGGKVHLIDFGLSFVSKKVEDKAVDLHLLHQALESRHHEVHTECFKLFIQSYKKTYIDAEKVLDRLIVVQKRGRNKK